MEGITGQNLNQEMASHLQSYINELDLLSSKIVQDNLSVTVVKPTIIGSYQDIINYRHAIETVKQDIKEAQKKKLESMEKDVLAYINFDEIDDQQSIQIIQVKDVPKKVLKSLVDQTFDKLSCDVLILINIDQDKASYLVKSNLEDANVWIKKMNELTQGSGGGRPNFAQGGTTQLSLVDEMIGKLQ
jgi:alanyl-tRNA synthetase